MQQPIPTLTASNVGRAALAAYLKTLAGAVAQDGVTVNMVLPGRIDTDRVARRNRPGRCRPHRPQPRGGAAGVGGHHPRRPLRPSGRVRRRRRVPRRRAAAFVTGEQVRVDGGLVAGY